MKSNWVKMSPVKTSLDITRDIFLMVPCSQFCTWSFQFVALILKLFGHHFHSFVHLPKRRLLRLGFGTKIQNHIYVVVEG